MFEEKIKSGALFLDMHIPGWRNKIDLEKLNLASCSSCILGQLFKDYNFGRNILGIDCEKDRESMGFTILGNGLEFERLTEEWKDYLNKEDKCNSPTLLPAQLVEN